MRRVASAGLIAALALPACARPALESAAPAPGCETAIHDWTGPVAFLDSAIAAGAAPGGVMAVSYRGKRFYHGAGRLGLDDPGRPDRHTVYDLASLTKVVGLTTAVMLAVSEGRIALDDPVTKYVPAFGSGAPERSAVTIRHLLAHASGLPGHRPLYREANSRREALGLVDTTPLIRAPGDTMVYSDLGAIVLTQAVEARYGERIDSLLARRVFGPLHMRSTRYLPPPSWRARIAPTEDDPWRGRVLRGEVHDENAARLGGVSGHAGLFSDAEDLLRFGEWLLGAVHSGGAEAPDTRSGPIPVHPSVAREFTRRQNLPPGSTRALGWDTPSASGSSAGRRFSPESFGHTGFTGTSIWIDPTRHLVLVLLTNRVHPTRANPRIGPLRSGLADRVVDAACVASSPPVRR
ncbi:MAG: serine hydrolase domain-containing protein [Gemmatimonadota bacterium]